MIMEPSSIPDPPDEDLVLCARSRPDHPAMERILAKYSSFVRKRASNYFLMGAEPADLIQEGMIGLFKAVRDFKPEKSNFRMFVEICVNRQLITAIKTATRQKHHHLNHSISIDRPFAEDDRTLLDMLPDAAGVDPLVHLERREVSDEVRSRILSILSDLEQEVLVRYLQGKSYGEISEEMQRGIKSIDNALQRAKRKIGEELSDLVL